MFKTLLILVLSAGVSAAASLEEMTKEMFKDEQGQLKYRAMTVGKSAQKPALIVFLHGMGERGDDNEVQVKHGVKHMLSWVEKNEKHATLIAPQCPTSDFWARFEGDHRKDLRLRFNEKPTESMRLVLSLIDEKISKGEIDPKRVYITGLSMGGFGTFDAVSRRPDLFAFAAPVCGGGDPRMATKMKEVPFWIFHGDQDTTVLPECSQVMVGALTGVSADVRYTQYAGVGHGSWTPAYNDKRLMELMFSKQKK